jgi:hypothetical protein
MTGITYEKKKFQINFSTQAKIYSLQSFIRLLHINYFSFLSLFYSFCLPFLMSCVVFIACVRHISKALIFSFSYLNVLSDYKQIIHSIMHKYKSTFRKYYIAQRYDVCLYYYFLCFHCLFFTLSPR